MTRLGFLGPRGTYSQQASMAISEKFFNNSQFIEHSTIGRIFEAVVDNDVDIGIVPVENVLGGVISDTMFELIRHESIKVTGSLDFPINHCLLGRTGSLGDIKVIRSRDQALWQCRRWLRQNCPNATLEPSKSTTSAITETQDGSVGFIASSIAAKEYGLNILKSNIGDNGDNVTRFFIISKSFVKEIQNELGMERIFLLLDARDVVGVLSDILSIFKRDNLNLSCIHSMPTGKGWSYYFFLGVDTVYDSGLFKNTLEKVKEYCVNTRILGVG